MGLNFHYFKLNLTWVSTFHRTKQKNRNRVSLNWNILHIRIIGQILITLSKVNLTLVICSEKHSEEGLKNGTVPRTKAATINNTNKWQQQQLHQQQQYQSPQGTSNKNNNRKLYLTKVNIFVHAWLLNIKALFSIRIKIII